MSTKRSRWDYEDDSRAEDQPSVTPPKRARSIPEPTATLPRPSQVPRPQPTGPPRSRYVPSRTAHPPIVSSRSVYCYERLNQIEEGSYGVVFRARDKETNDIVALKRFKLDEEKHGFPITALREVNSLIRCKHENVVNIREVVVGDTLTQSVRFSCYHCERLGYSTHPESSLSWTSSSMTSSHC